MKDSSLPLGLYRHYKGAYYKVTDIATHSETEEKLVVYQALYGAKGIWVRPLSMFTERVESAGEQVSRFAYIDPQTEVLEHAMLNVKQGQQLAFEQAFKRAESIISSMSGYISHSLSKCIEANNKYLLLVSWQTIEDHEVGFRQSSDYKLWKELLHHFYEPFPAVEHFTELY